MVFLDPSEIEKIPWHRGKQAGGYFWPKLKRKPLACIRIEENISLPVGGRLPFQTYYSVGLSATTPTGNMRYWIPWFRQDRQLHAYKHNLSTMVSVQRRRILTSLNRLGITDG